MLQKKIPKSIDVDESRAIVTYTSLFDNAWYCPR